MGTYKMFQTTKQVTFGNHETLHPYENFRGIVIA